MSMKTMYTWTVTTDNEVEYTKDEEIISIPQDRLASHVESFMLEEDADYYASHLINETYDIYKRELEKEAEKVHRVRRLMNKIQNIIGGDDHEA